MALTIRCETCKKALKQGETVYQGDLLHDVGVFPPTTRVPYWCEPCGDKKKKEQGR